MNRRSKYGAIDRILEGLQQAGVVRIKMGAFALDSIILKPHPDGWERWSERCVNRIGGSSRRSLRHCPQHSRHSHDVARLYRRFEVLVDALNPSVDGLSDATDRLGPAEVFLDALANRLANRVARMPCGSPVDGTAADAHVVACYVRRHEPVSAGLDKVACVVGPVGDRLGMTAGHRKRRGSLAHPVGVGDHRADRQPRAVFHQHVPMDGHDRCGAAPLPEQPCIRRTGMGVVGAPLAPPVGLGVASVRATAFSVVVAAVPGHEALVAGPGQISAPSTDKCSWLSKLRLSASVITSAKKLSTTACLSKQSRFLENDPHANDVYAQTKFDRLLEKGGAQSIGRSGGW
jgi:hypothetical protein